jgi:hypothetical protein
MGRKFVFVPSSVQYASFPAGSLTEAMAVRRATAVCNPAESLKRQQVGDYSQTRPSVAIRVRSAASRSRSRGRGFPRLPAA